MTRRRGRDTCCHKCALKARCTEHPTRVRTVCPYIFDDLNCQAAQIRKRSSRRFCVVCSGFRMRKPKNSNQTEMPFGGES